MSRLIFYKKGSIAWGLKTTDEMENSRAGHMAFFGDSENDIEMLQLAGISYAMENADPRVKTASPTCTSANTEGRLWTVL